MCTVARVRWRTCARVLNLMEWCACACVRWGVGKVDEKSSHHGWVDCRAGRDRDLNLYVVQAAAQAVP